MVGFGKSPEEREAQSARKQAVGRRRLFERGIAAIGGIVTALVGLPLIGFFGSAVVNRNSEQWLRVCSLDEVDATKPKFFKVAFKGEHSFAEYPDERGVFVILAPNSKSASDVIAFTSICTHMACPVRWLDWRQQILCPCHGGMYDRWGNLAGGPPAHSLPRYVTRIEGNSLFVANRYQSGQPFTTTTQNAPHDHPMREA